MHRVWRSMEGGFGQNKSSKGGDAKCRLTLGNKGAMERKNGVIDVTLLFTQGQCYTSNQNGLAHDDRSGNH